MIQTLLAFTGAAIVVALIPGPSTAVIVRQSVTAGRRAGVAAMLGNETGVVLWGMAAAFGLTALLLAVGGRFRSSPLSLYQGWTKGKSAPGRVEVVQALLAAGADPGIKTNDGKTALTIAREIGADDVIALLQQPQRRK